MVLHYNNSDSHVPVLAAFSILGSFLFCAYTADFTFLSSLLFVEELEFPAAK